jgi:hypothetical protein
MPAALIISFSHLAMVDVTGQWGLMNDMNSWVASPRIISVI